MKIVLIGLPGTGKTTVGKILSSKLSFPLIGVGDLLREEAKKETEEAKIIKEYLEKGLIVPVEITNKILLRKLKNLSEFILEGYPRNVEQAKFLLTHFPDVKVVLLKTPVEIIVQRLSSRRVCPKCGRIYNMIFDPPQNDEICDICKVKLVRREDDEPELIRKRIKIQEEGLREVLDYFSRVGKEVSNIEVTDAKTTPMEVAEKIIKKLKLSN